MPLLATRFHCRRALDYCLFRIVQPVVHLQVYRFCLFCIFQIAFRELSERLDDETDGDEEFYGCRDFSKSYSV